MSAMSTNRPAAFLTLMSAKEICIYGKSKNKKVPVNKQRFMEVLKLKNSSIRKLGDAYDEIQRTEKPSAAV